MAIGEFNATKQFHNWMNTFALHCKVLDVQEKATGQVIMHSQTLEHENLERLENNDSHQRLAAILYFVCLF